MYDGVFSVDYNRFVGQDQLSTGIQITHDTNEIVSSSTGSSSTTNTLFTSDFTYDQTLSAAYVTYQKPFGDKWVVLGGLRAEELDLKSNQLTTHTTGHISYTKVSPSFFATYLISDSTKLRFSYSHRLQRPNPQSLNPAILYVDAHNESQGNPNLKPQQTDSFELGYEATAPLPYQIRGYYRKNVDAITSLSTIIPNMGTCSTTNCPGVLTTQQNYGSGSASGLEFNVGGPLSKQLMVNVNGNLANTELSTPNIAGTQRATTLSGRFIVSYTVTPADSLQFFYFARGKQLTGQGYTSAMGMGNLAYSHKLTPAASVIMTLNDPFRTSKLTSFTKTNTVYSQSFQSQQGAVFYIGLRYLLGVPTAQQQQQQQRGPGGPGGMGGPGGGYRGGGAGGPGGPGGGMNY